MWIKRNYSEKTETNKFGHRALKMDTHSLISVTYTNNQWKAAWWIIKQVEGCIFNTIYVIDQSNQNMTYYHSKGTQYFIRPSWALAMLTMLTLLSSSFVMSLIIMKAILIIISIMIKKVMSTFSGDALVHRVSLAMLTSLSWSSLKRQNSSLYKYFSGDALVHRVSLAALAKSRPLGALLTQP